MKQLGIHEYKTCGMFADDLTNLCISCADLDNAMVWVYFHSNVKEYNRVECWGPLVEAAKVLYTINPLFSFSSASPLLILLFWTICMAVSFKMGFFFMLRRVQARKRRKPSTMQ
jgi:hypothetical protein